MLGVDKIGEIRRAHFREVRSIKGICRDLGVSRATVRKVLHSAPTRSVAMRRARRRSGRLRRLRRRMFL